MLKITVWNNGGLKEITSEMDYFVGRCGSGRTVFGENAKLVRTTKQHLVFETESGSIVKTEKDTLNTVGKAKKAGYFVAIGKRDYESKNIIRNTVRYWNDKKLVMEYK